ncbi:hypothetical protein BDW02DRAFT_570057, partial [Decorospora gaudefroyi]
MPIAIPYSFPCQDTIPEPQALPVSSATETFRLEPVVRWGLARAGGFLKYWMELHYFAWRRQKIGLRRVFSSAGFVKRDATVQALRSSSSCLHTN